MISTDTVLRFGTRGSALAQAQTDFVVQALARRYPAVRIDRVVITTAGDVDKTTPLRAIGGRGVFTSALEDALRNREIDAAVHSAKDLPSETPADFAIAAFLAREDPRDVFVSRHDCGLRELAPEPTIATSSRRRAVQVQRVRPDARIVDLRGNVDTRLRKALETDLDGIVLAAAGVARMGWLDRVSEFLSLDVFVPAPGQGALAVEIRAGKTEPAGILVSLDEPDVSAAVRVERAFLRAIGAGCSMPVGAHATVESGQIRVRAMLANDETTRVEFALEMFDASNAESAASELARRMKRSIDTTTSASDWARPERPRPLAAWRVLVTRALDDAGDIECALRDAGADPIGVPTIEIASVTDTAPLDAAISRLTAADYDWVVFTSRHAVDRVVDRLRVLAVSTDVLAAPMVAAVGKSTAARLTGAGIAVDLVPERSTAADVVAAMAERGVESARVLFPHGDLARDTIRAGLTAAGATVDTVEVYRTVPVREIPDEALRRLQQEPMEAVTLLSPSSAKSLAAILKVNDIAVDSAIVACIGPVTAEAAKDVGIRVDVIAEEATVESLVAAVIAQRCGEKGRQ